MGSFYTSHTVCGPSQQDLLGWLERRPAMVSRTENGLTVLLDQECEEQNGEVLASVASQISKDFDCHVLALLNHDDDVLYFELYGSGEKMDEYNSSPAFFSEDAESNDPVGGNVALLCSIFEAKDAAAVEEALRGDYVFAFERHRDLAVALGLPLHSVGIGYNYASEGDLPPDTPNGEYQRSEA